MPITVTLVKRSGLEVSAVDDPIDLDGNLTGTAGSTDEMRIKYKCNVSNAGSYKPVIVIETNDTTVVDDITMTKADSAGGKYVKITCADRLSTTYTDTKLYCFQRDKTAYASDGVILAYASLKYDATTAPADTDTIVTKMIDTSMYLKPGYTTISGILFGQEDDSDSDVGAGDSATYTIDYSD